MNVTAARLAANSSDLGLLSLRIGASVLVLIVHGLPKVLHYAAQAAVIEDPFHLGKGLSIAFAIFAEVVCQLFVMAGIATRLAALPVMIVSAIALIFAHPEWTVEQAQAAWMLLILFGAIAVAGPGRYSLATLLKPLEDMR